MPVGLLPICTHFFVDCFFLRGLIVLRGNDSTPLMEKTGKKNLLKGLAKQEMVRLREEHGR